MKNTILNFIIGFFALAIIVIIIIVSTKDLTTTESTLLGVLLTLSSVIASWITSSYFSQVSHKQAIEEVRTEYQNNLRTYALNAAEKVDNLSNELLKLSLYLKAELDNEDESDENAYISKVERIQSAIHIVNTLKSVNDTSLSDWKGVIGEELEEREEEKEERQERLIELTEKIESIINKTSHSKPDDKSSELDAIKNQLDAISKSIGTPVTNLRSVRTKPKKENVSLKCPNCSNPLSYLQRPNINGRKTVKCNSCDKRHLSRFSDKDGFYLIQEKIESEIIKCPNCDSENKIEISNIPFTKEIVTCQQCKDQLKINRKIDLSLGISLISKVGPDSEEDETETADITPELLDKVLKNLPEQPWPVGIHKVVAEKIGQSNRTVSKSIYQLIEEGKVNPQINGVVYVKSDIKREEADSK